MTVFTRTKEELCNQAFTLLGAGQLISFDDGTNEGDIAAALYGSVRDSVLTSYVWRCTRKKAALSRFSAGPANEWRYRFQLPSDMLDGPRAVFISDRVGATPIAEFEIFHSRELYADQPEVWIDYMIRPDINDWPPYLYSLMQYALAAEFAEPATDQTSKADYWRTVAWGGPTEGGKGGYSRTARNLDAQGQQVQQIRDDTPLINARF